MRHVRSASPPAGDPDTAPDALSHVRTSSSSTDGPGRWRGVWYLLVSVSVASPEGPEVLALGETGEVQDAGELQLTGIGDGYAPAVHGDLLIELRSPTLTVPKTSARKRPTSPADLRPVGIRRARTACT